MSITSGKMLLLVAASALIITSAVQSQETSYIYGIHDHEPSPQEWLTRVNNGGAKSWVTATVAIGHNPNDYSGGNFTSISSQGHAVICRLNNGYGTSGTIPVISEYGNFATRCANYVNASSGCDLWIIGNETNLAAEWPKINGWRTYISPQDYANCFRQCYNAIKAVRPNAKVIPQALAPFAGPYSAGADHDGVPIGWTTYMNQMLTAINSTGGLDGIAVHINSRGYTYADVHSTAKVNGQYFSFYVYKDWVNLGTPASLRTLPYYATECNGIYYWKGGHPECPDYNNPSCTYQADWIEWIYAEINSWNAAQASSGEGIYHCVNMYRWCNGCDGWNIDGSSVKGQMLSDLDSAVAHGYEWGDPGPPPEPDLDGSNIAPASTQVATSSNFSGSWGGDKAIDGDAGSGSKWVSDGSAMPEWLKLDLGGDKTVYGVKVRHAGAGGEPTTYNTEAFQIQTASSFNGTYSTVSTVNNSAQDDVSVDEFSSPITTRYIRLYITDAGVDNYTRIPEFEVWGEAAASTPTIALNPTSLSPSCDEGTNAVDGSFTVQNSGTGTLSYSITDNVSWLSCSPTSGTSTGEADTITVSYTTSSLSAGTHNATITVSDSNATNNPQTIAVTLTVNSTGGGMTDSVPTGTNLALSATQVATSADFGVSWGGDKAIDGVTSSGSKWVSDGSAMPEWLKLDLGANYTVNGFIVRHASAGGEPTTYNTEDFQIQSGTSYTGPWTDETVVDNSSQSGVTNRSYVTPKTLRYVRLYITDAGIDNYTRIPEFEVLGVSGGGGPTTVAEDFESMPSWSSSFDAGWGSAATWSIVSGGQSGNALQASRGSQGSSAKAKVYAIDASTSYTISIYIRCPSHGGAYWAECAYKLGSHTASDFDNNGGTWTMIQKFDNGGTNGNGDTWTQYSLNFNSGSDTQITVGYKLGSSGGAGPTVHWDTLRVE